MTVSQHAGVRSTIGSVVVTAALVVTSAGCGEAPAGTAAGTGATATSTPAAIPTERPTASPTPAATPLPDPIAGRWVAAGSTVGGYAYAGAQVLALPDGGAVLIGVPLDEDGPVRGVLATERWDPITGWRAGASTGVPRAEAASTPVGGEYGRAVFIDAVGGVPILTCAVVVLRDGRVLVAGGDDGAEHSIASVSIYDPEKDTWIAAAPMGQARSHASAALLPDGRVLVVGGFAWEPFQHTGPVEAVQFVQANDPLDTPERDDSIALLDVAPEPLGPALATAEVFDPASNLWAPTEPMRYARTGPAIASLTDGRILVVGASAEAARLDSRAYTTAEVWDGETGTFTLAGPLPGPDRVTLAERGLDLPDAPPEPGDTGTLIALPDGGAALVARSISWKHEGQAVWSMRLAPDLATWRFIGEPFAVREFHDPDNDGMQTTGVSRAGAVAVGLADGSVFVGGGSPGPEVPDSPPASVSVERYDPTSDSWADGPSLPEPRIEPLAVRLSEGTILLVGGQHQVGSGDDATREWARETWRLLPGGWTES